MRRSDQSNDKERAVPGRWPVYQPASWPCIPMSSVMKMLNTETDSTLEVERIESFQHPRMNGSERMKKGR
eukprot:scaffold627_cov125-Cylindrotheca_fusiformis.AAC.5